MIPNCKKIDKEIASLNKSNMYSTEEQKIGIWVDGKPLYRKTLVLPNGTEKTEITYFDLGIDNVEEIFIAQPSFYSYLGNKYPFPYNDGNAFEVLVNSSYVGINIGFEPISKERMVVTVNYTKTTD